MSKSARSVYVFSIYLFVLGLILEIIPNILLSLFFIPETSEVWIRVVGMLVLILVFNIDYYILIPVYYLRKEVKGDDPTRNRSF